jgi:hypothetical protein
MSEQLILRALIPVFAQSNAILAEQKREEIGRIKLRLQKLLDSFLD